MKNSKPKVVKVIYDTWKKIILFDNGKMLDDPIEEKHWYIEDPVSISNDKYILFCDYRRGVEG